MYTPRALISLLAAVLLLHSLLALVSAQGSKASRWQTLRGNAPLVIARGGFSGIFPESSYDAYQLALLTSVPNVFFWCDVQLTKDGVGICASNVNLGNCTDIYLVYPDRAKTYLVDGAKIRGWFSLDFTYNESLSINYLQGIYSRSNKFDGGPNQVQTVENVAAQRPTGLWLNIQHNAFFTEHNLNMRSYVLSVSRRVVVNYISSPEVAFLRSIAARFNPNITKLILRFLGPSEIEPSTNQTYNSLLQNLTFITTFASGILIPKAYIWPVDRNSYLQPHTSIVLDAHKAGLEVFASDFYNDVPLPYNYSFDPVSESLSFVDNGNFSVDGMLTDFPITQSAAIECFSHVGKNATEQVKFLVISKNGASGDYPGCTDIAYQNAILDGADVIDCPVQMSKDGIPFCLSSINLIDSTTVAQSIYSNFTTSIPELKSGTGIFTFSLTWSQIQTLTPQISNPESKFFLSRNPKFRNAGKLITLSDFLALANDASKKSSLSGVLVSIENAAYLMEKQELPVIDAVLDTLSKAGYDSQTAIKVMIQSSNSSVLEKFKEKSNYDRVYMLDENIRGIVALAIDDIKSFANSVVVSKSSVFPDNALFLTGSTDVVQKLQKANLNVYVQSFSNEFTSQPWDFFSDATVEINSYVTGAGVNGVVTDFPLTSARYKRNVCLNSGNNTPLYMAPVEPGSLLRLIAPAYLPPAEAPNPLLLESDVAEAPLPGVVAKSPVATPGGTTAGAPSVSNGQPRIGACIFLSYLALLFATLLLLNCN